MGSRLRTARLAGAIVAPVFLWIASRNGIARAEGGSAPATPFLTEDAPLRALAAAFGFRTSGSLRTGRVRVFSGPRGRERHEIVIVPGIPRALIDGRGVPLLTAPRFVGGQLVVPAELADIVRRMGGPTSSAGAPSSTRPAPRKKPKTAFLPATTDHTGLLLAGGAGEVGGAGESSDSKAPACGAEAPSARRRPALVAGPSRAPSSAKATEGSAPRSSTGAKEGAPEEKTGKTKKTEAGKPDRKGRVRRRSRGLVLIDPGHGGKDEGTCGPKGTKEKDVVLGIARLLAAELRRRGVRAELTRADDSFVSLSTRAASANRLEADLLVSLHVNSYPKGYVTGVETWVAASSGRQRRATEVTESTETERRGKPEGAGLGPAPADKLRRLPAAAGARSSRELSRAAQSLPSVTFVSPPPGGQALWFTRRRQASRSATLAKKVQAALAEATGERDRGVRAGHFTVLRECKVPAVLVETGFISNPKTEKRLARAAYRGRIAKALARAIVESGLLRERVAK